MESNNINSTRRPLNIAFIGMKGLPPDRPGAGGGERETDAKSRRLAARGHNVTVYCRWNYYRHPPELYEGIHLISLPALNSPGLQMLSHTFLATLHTIFTRKTDVVSYHGMGNALYLPLVKLAGKKAVVYMDGIDWERPKWGKNARRMLKLAASAAFRWADAVYVDNETSQKQFSKYFGKEPMVITLAADIWEPPGDDLLVDLDITPENYILFVGMLRPDKGVHLLIDAYNKLDTDVPLVIVGENPDNPTYVNQLKKSANGRVKFLGYQYGQVARHLFANSLIYVQPSVMEGNSPALMSAMACGRCVVVNGIDQNRETIGDAGIAFDAGNSDDLLLKLEELLQNRSAIREFGIKALQRIQEVYSWERVMNELDELYYQINPK